MYPNATSTVDTSYPIDFKWDTKCQIDTDSIDLYVYQPSSATNPLIQKFTNIPYSQGTYSGRIYPSWGANSTESQVYISIMKAGGQAWSNSIDLGPTFDVMYTPTVVTVSGSAVTQPPQNTGATTFENVTDTGGKKSNKGIIAVAVVVPIVVVCIAAAIAFYFYRIKEKKKLHRWSQALSQHSALEWEKGALPGESAGSYGRPSSAYSRSGGRPSTGYGRPSTGYGRPSNVSGGRPTSSVYLDNMAGAGAGLRAFPGSENMDPNRSSLVLPDGQVRQSRISFAENARPRMSSDTRPRVASGLHNTKTSIDELRNFEAVALVTHPTDSHDYIAPSPDHTESLVGEDSSATSPTSPSRPIYGPDQMLAVYAQRKGSTSPTPPQPVVTALGSKVKRFLSRKEKTNPRAPTPQQQDIRVTAPSPEPTTMRSYVHLNTGTASAQDIGNLPAPGPSRPESSQSNRSTYEDAAETLDK